MALPNFMIIGAAKSGTTSLWSYLNQHPQVFFPVYKEPNYFALQGQTLPDGGPAAPEVLQQLIHVHSITDFERYSSLFADTDDRPAVGEASVRYLYYASAAARIRERLPDVRLIAVLRDPVSRLYSHYCMNVQYQLEPLDLDAAIAAEDERHAAGWGWDWHYRGVSSYAVQVQRYLSLFDPAQVKIFLYDDLVKRPLQTYQAACRHIGIDSSFVPDMTERGKVTTQPRYKALDRWLNWPNATREAISRIPPRRLSRGVFSLLRRWNARPIPRLDPAARKRLLPLFRADIRALEETLGRRTHWAT